MASYTLHIQYVDRPAETRTFTQAKITFGRDAGDIVLHDSQVSGRHGEITFDGNTLRYTDVGSTNGSFLMQGQRVANIELTPGIALRLGNSLVTVTAIDAPNVAGKGRTVIAGPGMAPGFPAPMRPPGPGPVVAAGAPIPRPPAPQPVAPGAPPAGGFAFAPTAQMQSPLSPPVPPSQQPRPGFSAAPPQPGFSPAPPQPGPPAPVFAAAPPQPAFSPAPAAVPPGPPPMAVAPAPMPVPAAPDPEYAPTPIPEARAPVAAPPMGQEIAPLPTGGESLVGEAPKDPVGALKFYLAAMWKITSPVFVSMTIVFAAVFVAARVFMALLLTILPVSLLGVIGILGWIVGLALLVATVVIFPSAFRHTLGHHFGMPIDMKSAIKETVAKGAERPINCAIPMAILGLFAGPIYFIENRKLGDVIKRNFDLWKLDWVGPIVSIIVLAVAIAIPMTILSMILIKLPFGLVLASAVGALLSSVMYSLMVGLSIAFYFSHRRKEGGDPDSEAHAALAGIASLPQ